MTHGDGPSAAMFILCNSVPLERVDWTRSKTPDSVWANQGLFPEDLELRLRDSQSMFLLAGSAIKLTWGP